MAVYTGELLGGGDTPDDYHPCKVILVQHEGVWVILNALEERVLALRKSNRLNFARFSRHCEVTHIAQHSHAEFW